MLQSMQKYLVILSFCLAEPRFLKKIIGIQRSRSVRTTSPILMVIRSSTKTFSCILNLVKWLVMKGIFCLWLMTIKKIEM